MTQAADPWAAFTPQVADTGEQLTPEQAAYARSNMPFRDPAAQAGTPTNPGYVTPTRPARDGVSYVTPGGQLVTPGSPDDAWAAFSPQALGQVGLLPQTPAMKAALAADAARQYALGHPPPGSINAPQDPNELGGDNFINGWLFGREPEVRGAIEGVNTALSNAYRRVTGQPVAYGASDAYEATKAAAQDRLATWQAQHPVQGLFTGGAGAALNPLNMLAGAGISRLAGYGIPGFLGATGASSALGAGEGAIYGSADPNDPAGSAGRGAIAGAIGGAAAVPIGAAGGAIVRGVVNSGRRLVAGPLASFGDAVRDVTPWQAQAAQALRTDMAGRGVDVSVPEAIQQVTNNGTALGRMQRVLESTKRGEQLLAPFFANRTAQVQGAVQDAADALAPATTQPSMIGRQAQGAADASLNDARKFVNWGAKPYYDALPGQSLPNTEYLDLVKDPTYAAALREVRTTPELNVTIAHLPDNDLSVINEVQKRIQGMAESATPNPANPQSNYQLAARRGSVAGRVDDLASAASPDWRAARDGIAAGRQAYVEPLQTGPLGAIANTDSVPAQTGALYPAQPLAGAPAETAQAVQWLEHQQPGVGGALTRQHVLGSLNLARPELNTGPNPYVGSAFAVKVAGNPEREATFLSGLSSLPDGENHAANMQRLLEGLRATGKRQPVGSKTAFNASDLSEWQVPPAARALESFSIAEPLEPIAQVLKSLNYRRNVNGLADFMTTPADQTADLIRRAQGAAPEYAPGGLLPLPYPGVAVPLSYQQRNAVNP